MVMLPLLIVTLSALVCASTHSTASKGVTSYIDQTVYEDLLTGSRSILFISAIHTAPYQKHHSLSPKHEKASRLIIIVDKPRTAAKGKVKSSSVIPNYVYYNLSLSAFETSSLSMRILLHGGRLLSQVAPLLYHQLLAKTSGSYNARFFLLNNKTRGHKLEHTLVMYGAEQKSQSIYRYNLDQGFQPNVAPCQLSLEHMSVFSSPTEMSTVYANYEELTTRLPFVLFWRMSVTYSPMHGAYFLNPDHHSVSSTFYGCTIGKNILVVTTDRESTTSQCKVENAQPVSFTAGFIGEHRVYLFTPNRQVLSFAKSALYQNDASGVSRFDLETIPLGNFFLFDGHSRHSKSTTAKTSTLFFWLALFLPASIVILLILLYYFLQPPRREPIQPGSLLRTSNVVVREIVKRGLEEEAKARAAGVNVDSGAGHWLPPPQPATSPISHRLPLPQCQAMPPPQPPPTPQHWSPMKDHNRPFPMDSPRAPSAPKVSDAIVAPTFSDASDWRPKVLVGESLNVPAIPPHAQPKGKSPNTSLATDAVSASKGKLFKGRKASKQSFPVTGAGGSASKPAVSPSKAKTVATRKNGKTRKKRQKTR